MTRRLAARLDNLGDVLLTGPAVRAMARPGDRLTFLAGPAGRAAAEMLPGVDDVVEFAAPWVGDDAPPVDVGALDELVDAVPDVDEAVIFTSFHQSPLPLATVLRMAGVPLVAATCVDHPGSLLDLRHPYLPDLHEVEQALSLVEALGHRLPPGDDRRLAVRLPGRRDGDLPGPVRPPTGQPFVVVHPGASVPARALPPAAAADAVEALVAADWQVVVTGSAAEADLIARVAGPARAGVIEAAGGHDLAGFAGLLAGAAAVVCGNTGPAHLAAAVGCPVVSTFAPVVPPHRWRPWGVPQVLLGVADIACAGCRARICPVPGQPCLAPFEASAVVDAVHELTAVAVERSPRSAA